MSVWRMKKPRHKEVKQLVQGHTRYLGSPGLGFLPRWSGSRVTFSSFSAVPSELCLWCCGLGFVPLLPPAPIPIFGQAPELHGSKGELREAVRPRARDLALAFPRVSGADPVTAWQVPARTEWVHPLSKRVALRVGQWLRLWALCCSRRLLRGCTRSPQRRARAGGGGLLILKPILSPLWFSASCSRPSAG